ncbi:hypothetical protein BpHYR1_031971 [Brachionus plicatilis]|uniref:Uncharacterized protein n=1 Tax=Brachionus plicatilis TaxID=10195 RepID=A0A3M7SP21_BRAPC|nr:hypothetical protein BpHYR1_031971 [Brachionus plicatilis]
MLLTLVISIFFLTYLNLGNRLRLDLTFWSKDLKNCDLRNNSAWQFSWPFLVGNEPWTIKN